VDNPVFEAAVRDLIEAIDTHEKPIAEIQTPQPRSQVDQKLSKYNLPWILLGLIGLLILL